MEWLKIYLMAAAFSTVFVTIRYFGYATLAYLFFWKFKNKITDKKRIQKSDFKSSDLRRDIFWSFLACPVFAMVLTIPLHPALIGYTKIYRNIEDYGQIWYFLSLPTLMFIHDTYFYWVHRLNHHPKVFPLFHRLHHQTTNVSPFSSYSQHPVENLMQAFWLIPIVFLLPIHPSIMYTYGFIAMAQNTIGHLGVELYPESWKRNPLLKWLSTSSHHNLHHQYFRGNYGYYFLFWDRLLNTERIPNQDSTEVTTSKAS
jgi:lathosterol oxidase